MTIQEVKRWLMRFMEQEQDLDNLMQQYDMLDSAATAPSAAKIDGMPHSPNHSGDPVGSNASRLCDLSAEISELQAEATATRREIESVIKRIAGRHYADLRGVLRFRYILCLPWPDVCNALWGGKVDFLDREDTYMRRTFRIHGDAVKAIAELLSE